MYAAAGNEKPSIFWLRLLLITMVQADEYFYGKWLLRRVDGCRTLHTEIKPGSNQKLPCSLRFSSYNLHDLA